MKLKNIEILEITGPCRIPSTKSSTDQSDTGRVNHTEMGEGVAKDSGAISFVRRCINQATDSLDR
jgi:hypothetical protein